MSAELDNPIKAPKISWYMKSRFLNKRKISATPPVLADGKLVSDFKTKTDCFNSHSAVCCVPFKNVGILPDFKYRTNKSSKFFTIYEHDLFLLYTFLL